MLRQRCQLTPLSQRCELLPLSQRCQCNRCQSAVSYYRCHTSMHSNVTALSLSSLLHRCPFISLTHYCRCYRCHIAIWATVVTIQSSTPLSQYCHYHRCHASANRHRCDISVECCVTVVLISTAVPPWDCSCVVQSVRTHHRANLPSPVRLASVTNCAIIWPF